MLKTSSNEQIHMLLDLVILLFLKLVLAFQKIKTVFTHHWLFSVLNCSCAEDFPVLPTDGTMGKWGPLSFPTVFERRDITAVCCYWQWHLTWGQEGRKPTANLLPGIPALQGSAGSWGRAGHRRPAGGVQQEPRWATAPTPGSVRQKQQGARCSSSLPSQLPSNLHTENPGLQAQGRHKPSSLTCCRDWSSSGHVWNSAAAIWDNLHKQERHMYRWLQA